MEEPLPEWDRIEPTVRTVRLGPGEFLFRAGEKHRFVYCVGRGVLKLVYEDADGDEWVKAFVHEGLFFASIAALQPEGRTSFSVVALEESEVERVDYGRLLAMAERYPQWQKMLRRAFEFYGQRKERRERELLTLSAEERYRRFLVDNPHLDGRVPQKDLARYLGITPVGLSRIKARVRAAEPAPSGQ